MGTTQSEFQAKIEATMGGNADDGADISDEVLGAGEEEVTEDGSEEVTEDEVGDTEGTEQVTNEPTYKKGQVEAIVKTRVNTLNRRIDKLSSYKSAVDKLCELTGLDFNSLTNRLMSMSVEEQAKILGKTPQEIRQAKMVQDEIARERGKTQTLTRQLEEQKLKTDPKFSDFDLYKEEIDELIEDNPKLSLKQAYLLAKGDTALTSAARDAEQRTVAKIVNSQKKGVVKPVGAVGDKGVKLDAATISAAKLIGMDPVEYAKYQEIDNLDAYRAAKKKK